MLGWFKKRAALPDARIRTADQSPWFKRVPAVVFACLLPGELRILLHADAGLADGGIPHNVAADLVPPELWLPNTPLWVELDDAFNVVRVWRREE